MYPKIFQVHLFGASKEPSSLTALWNKLYPGLRFDIMVYVVQNKMFAEIPMIA